MFIFLSFHFFFTRIINQDIDPVTKRRNYKNITNDIIKLFGTISISELVFIVKKLYIDYSLLSLNYQPYVAITIAELTSWVVFLVLLNVSFKQVKLLK